MKTLTKKIVTLVVLLSFVIGMSSCHRGYGCPNNFSLGEKMVKTVTTYVSTFDIKNE